MATEFFYFIQQIFFKLNVDEQHWNQIIVIY